jgi:hypothetical protein
MISCLEFRRQPLAEPSAALPEMDVHAETCRACREFRREITDMDNDLKQAFGVSVPEGLAARVLLNQSRTQLPRRPSIGYLVGMAASFFVVVCTVLVALREPGIGERLITHVEQEGSHLHPGPVPAATVLSVLGSISTVPTGSMGKVLFASNCIIDGELVAHLIVRKGDEQFTLLVVPTPIRDSRSPSKKATGVA